MNAIVSIMASITFGVIGQVFIKKGLNRVGPVDFSLSLIQAYSKILLSVSVLTGMAIYFAGVFFWLHGLSKVELSFAYPFISLSYVLVFVASWWLLGEHIPLSRWLGLIAICIGVIIVAKS
jgi:drug/metabolite transporter (DMT)-like permease